MSAPTSALPTTAPPRLKLTVVAPADADPMFWTVADRVMALVSFGDAGVHDTLRDGEVRVRRRRAADLELRHLAAPGRRCWS